MRKAEKSNGILLQLAEKRVDHRGTVAVGHDEPRGGGGGADLDQRNVETRPGTERRSREDPAYPRLSKWDIPSCR